MAVAASHAINPYLGRVDVQFLRTDRSKPLSVMIFTDNLYLDPVSIVDREALVALRSDPKVMEKFLDGKPIPRETTEKRVAVFAERWRSHCPFNALGIRERRTGEMVGYAAINAGDRVGEAEIGFILDRPFWNKGYGKEATTAILHHYVPQLKARGYEINGYPLTSVVGTARVDNTYSVRILEDNAMAIEETSEKYGAQRYHFRIAADQLGENKLAWAALTQPTNSFWVLVIKIKTLLQLFFTKLERLFFKV